MKREEANLFFEIATKLIRQLNIEKDDVRVTYTLGADSTIALTVGRRYCFVAYPRGKYCWQFISDSPTPLSESAILGDEYRIKKDTYYYRSTDVNDLNLHFDNIYNASKSELDEVNIRRFPSSSPAFEQAIFDQQFRQELFAKAYNMASNITSYWIFQCNPAEYDFARAVRENLLHDWQVTAL